jgi:hypothetical protein
VEASDSLRAQAARLFALATQARETGNLDLADLLTEAAGKYLDEATVLESREATKPPTHDAPPMLQQQQKPPKK